MFLIILLLCFGSLNTTPIYEEQTLSLSVENAVQIAFQKNTALQALAQEINSLRAQTMIDASLPDAEIGLDYEGLRVLKNSNVEHEYSFGLVQSLPFPGKLGLRTKIGHINQQEAVLKLEQQKLLLATEVKKAYYLCLLNQKTKELWGKNSALLEDLQETAISLYALGKVPYEDILRLKIEIARAKNELLQADRNYLASLEELKRLLHLSADVKLNLTSPLVYQPLPDSPQSMIEKARLSSPSIKSISYQKERAGLLVQLADKNKLPDFVFGFYMPSHRFGAVGFSAGITYPLFSKKRISGEKLLAEAERQKASYHEETVSRFFESRKKQAMENILAAEQQVKIFSEQLLAETEALLNKARADFRLGRLDSLNLLDIFRNAILVDLEYHRAVYLYLVSLAEFESAGENYF